MSLYLETKVGLSPIQEDLVNHVQGNHFPWFVLPTIPTLYMFSHTLMGRHLDKKPVEGVVCSPFYDIFKDIFLGVCKENGVQVNTILRACINNTSYHPAQYGGIHLDHDFPHKQFIWNLNEFTSGPTYLFDEDDNIVKTTTIGKNKATIFSQQKHAQGFCQPGEQRINVIFTFI